LSGLAVDHYTDYFNFLMHQVSQVGLPQIEALPVDPDVPSGHPLAAAGTVLLIDPAYSSWDQSPWPPATDTGPTAPAMNTATYRLIVGTTATRQREPRRSRFRPRSGACPC